MGLDTNGVRFLVEARENGVTFDTCATLGRQGLHISVRDFQSILRRNGIVLEQEEATRIVENADGHEPGYAESLLTFLGAKNIFSIDHSSYENATHLYNLNSDVPIDLVGKCDCLIDGGTLEHVFNFPFAIRTCMSMIKKDGHFLMITVSNNFMGHGFYQFSPELFYGLFSPANGFCVERMFIYEHRKNATWYHVEEPRKIGKRVELVNRVPTLLLVQAKRTEVMDLADITPQQSDYVETWHSHEQQQNSGDTNTVSYMTSMIDRFRHVAPRWMKDIYHYNRHRVITGFRKPFFRKYG